MSPCKIYISAQISMLTVTYTGADPGFLISGGADLKKKVFGVTKK